MAGSRSCLFGIGCFPCLTRTLLFFRKPFTATVAPMKGEGDGVTHHQPPSARWVRYNRSQRCPGRKTLPISLTASISRIMMAKSHTCVVDLPRNVGESRIIEVCQTSVCEIICTIGVSSFFGWIKKGIPRCAPEALHPKVMQQLPWWYKGQSRS